MKPTQRLVEVYWDDAHATAEQQPIDARAGEYYVCTVGYVVYEDARSLCVAAEILDDGSGQLDVRGRTRVPKGMILETRELRRVAPRSRSRIGETK
jgi:hypothetical protein